MLKKKRTALELSVLVSAIGIIFNYDEHWLEFFYSHKSGELRLSPEDLLLEAVCYSGSEQVLIKAALDLWTGEAYTNLAEIIEGLDSEDFQRVMLAILAVREISIEDLDEMRLRYET